MQKILIINQENDVAAKRVNQIQNLGFNCQSLVYEEEAIYNIQHEQPDVILNEVDKLNAIGLELIRAANAITPPVPVIIFTKTATVEIAVKAMKLGAFDFIPRTPTPELLIELLNAAILHYQQSASQAIEKIDEKSDIQLKNIIGKSTIMKEIANRVQKVARSDANVFIYGESGTGKELIAQNIHRLSQRSEHPFIPLDCAALPATLLESEIFGFEHGAFTGAIKSKPGVMELADSGTLFLDEIGELEPILQTKLLRVLQERQFRRVGGTSLIKVNVRIISASNRDPQKAVEEKTLRKDLFYRLNVVPICLPPLRDRKEDIPLLVNHFITKFNPSCPHEITGITKEAMRHLKNYNWPGNIRELQNTIEQAMSLTDQNKIGIKDLLENILENRIVIADERYEALDFKTAKQKYLNCFYEQYFDKLFKKYNGNMTKIAKEAGISRRTLYRLLSDLNKF